MNEDLNLLGDCVEAVYNQVDASSTVLPIEKIKKIVDAKTKPEDFEVLKNIAKGGYGEVFLVKKEKILAMKRVSKDLVLKQPHTALYMAEKEALVDSIGSQWLVSAEMTLQDNEYLYYVMDFIPGGDFMGLLAKEDVLEEEWVRFYVVEMVAALDELHSLGWIHRDLKPDNILIGLDGHIRLADFGSCIRMVEGKAKSSITVGTPDYVSPDILTSKTSENEYTETLDFWTLGVIIYEMIYGVTPFYSNTLVETYRKITDVDFIFPFKIGDDLKDLIKKLICKKEERLDIQGIKSHPFFKGVDWGRVKEMVPPFIPEIKGEYDTSHFVDSHFEVEKKSGSRKGEYLPFVGFTHDPQLVECIRGIIGDSSDGNVNANDGSNKAISPTSHHSSQPISTLDTSSRLEVLAQLDVQIKDHSKEVKDKKNELQSLMVCVLSEKEELDKLNKDIEEKKESLRKILLEIKDKEEFLTSSKKEEAIVFKDDDHSDVIKLQSTITESQSTINCLQSEITTLQSEFNSLNSTITSLNSSITRLEEDNAKINPLKKQVRILSTETKEYQQKLNQEISLRKSLEDELKSIKMERDSLPRPTLRQEFVCLEFPSRKPLSLRILDDQLFLNDTPSHLNNVFLQDLKNNELHHESYKTRSLILKVIFIKECIKSVSSTGRRNIKSLEEDIRIEESMIKGLEEMIPLLKGPPLEEATSQLLGSQKKISQLRTEIEMARKSTLTEDIPEDPVKLYEFNNHLFSTRTFPQGTLCEHCNEVLYGIKDQGFECRDCRMVVHKSCYVLGDVSCEVYKAFRSGEMHYVIMRSIEDKERLISVYKRI